MYPHFYNGQMEGIRDGGSDTTIFMMQQIGDLYEGAGLYGCTINAATRATLYNTADQSSNANLNSYCDANANNSTSDVVDNFDRTEVTTGVDEIGSSAGQAQLCGEADGSATSGLPSGFNVDVARSSKPSDNLAGCNEEEFGYAKDGVDAVDFPTINPGSIGASTFSQYEHVNGGTGDVGPVTKGWLPGDSVNGPYSGTAFSDLENGAGDTLGGRGNAPRPPRRAPTCGATPGRSSTGAS